MEIVTTLSLFLTATAFVLYAIITEGTDWIGRAELIEKRWPRLWGLMNNRPMRLVLIIVALGMIAHVIQDFRTDGERVQVNFPAPRAPAIEAAKSVPPESPSSLRRRTLKLADELSDYVTERNAPEKHPPRAYPNSADPNPSEERKKLIRDCVAYDQATEDYYAKHYRDRMIGILREYNVKGVKTGYLEATAAQRIPTIMPPESSWEGTSMDDLGQFRSLAYRVDAQDNLIVF